MIDLYTFGTGNGKRASVMLEECALPYTVHKVDLTKGEQNTPQFRRLNPLGVIPVIVDSDGPGGKPLTLGQSGAIALYAAEKSGRFLPRDPALRLKTLEWLMHAVSDGAQTTGNIFQSNLLPDKPASAIDMLKKRLTRFFTAIDSHLAGSEYLVGELSIADFALYTVVATGRTMISTKELANLERWANTIGARPAVVKGMAVPG